MMKPIKILYIVSVCLLLLSTQYAFTKATSCSMNNAITSEKTLVLEKTITMGKLLTLPAILGYVLYVYKDKVLYSIQNAPITALATSCWLTNFISNTFIKYQQLKQTLLLFKLTKKIYRYILYALAIKNTMSKLTTKNSTYCFCEEDFFQTIMDQVPFSFSELEQFTLELLHTSANSMHNLYIEAHINLEEKIYMLCKKNLTIEELLELYQNDIEFYPYLQRFNENPVHYYQITLHKLNTLIKKHVFTLIQE